MSLSFMLVLGMALATTNPARIEAVKHELAAGLAKTNPNAKITTRVESGPLDLQVIAAVVENAYPGSGVWRVLLDAHGVTYGVHGDKDLADLIRARGWHKAPGPDAATLRKLADLAQFEGLAMWLEDPPTTAVQKGDTLTLTAFRTWHPSGGRTRIVVTVGATGKAIVVSTTEK